MIHTFDCHCHISTISDTTIGCICNATKYDDWEQLLLLHRHNNNIEICCGIHPWYADTWTADIEYKLNTLLKNNTNIMVGETGLDKNYQSMDTQLNIFIHQLHLAIKYNRTIQIHCVGTWDKIIQILTKNPTDIPIIFHNFNGSPQIISKLLKQHNAFFSYSAKQLDNTNQRTIINIQSTPQDKLLIESDATVDNTHINPIKMVKTLSFILNKPTDILYDQIHNNYIRCIQHG